MERDPSASSPATSPLALFGSAHATRSPFHWDQPQQDARRRSFGDGEHGVQRTARSLPRDGFLYEPLLWRHDSQDRGGGGGGGPASASSPSAALAELGRRPASVSGPPTGLRLPPPAPSSNAGSQGGAASGDEGGGGSNAATAGRTSPLSTALHSITESVRGSLRSASWRSGSGVEAHGLDRLPSSESEAVAADLEAALPPEFEHRMNSNYADHPAFQRRLDAASDGGSSGPQQASKELGTAGRIGIDAVTGVINAVVSLPVMMSFAVIIFKDAFFGPWAGSLVRLVLLSAAIHQAAFTALSNIRFAVGQVQDVGLIFMSSIASSVVAAAKHEGLSDEETLGTVLLTLTGSTLLVGVLIVAVGQLKLASGVQYIPLSVIGGYLGFVGWYVAAAGASLATGKTFDSLGSWAQLASADVATKLAPAVGGAGLLWLVTHRVRSPWALPAALLAMPTLFFAVLYGPLRSDVAAARAAGWVKQSQAATAPEHFWDVWRLFNIRSGGILWSALPRQLPTVLALAFVVAFGSSLDVAAIQQDNPEELDYNAELTTVGISNIVAGLTGAGYTGSYIFSQTIFSMRARVSTRAAGIVLVACELAIFAAPFSVLDYLPLCFFGSLMLWIGYEIVKDWLVSSHRRMTHFEYITLWLTFAAIMAAGLELGIAAGLLLSALFFSFQYARVHVTAFSVVPSRSGVVRTFQQRTLLEVFAGRMVAVSLSGYIFFGSSVKIGDRVCQIVRSSLLASEADSREQTAAGGGAEGPPGLGKTASEKELLAAGELEGSIRHRASAAVFLAPRFCLLDFRRVTGMDGTAGRQFSTLRRRLQQLGIELVITHLPTCRPEVQQLLLANGVIAASGAAPLPGMCRAFPSLDEGLHYCEEVLLDCAQHYGLMRPPASRASLADVLRTHLEYPKPLLPGQGTRYGRAAADMAAFLHPRFLEPGEVLFRPGDASDELYIIEAGSVLCHIDYALMSPVSRRLTAAEDLNDATIRKQARLFQYNAGAIIGELDFFMQRPRSFLARADSPTSLQVLPRPAFERMAAKAPSLAILLQAAVLRCTSLSAAHALEALEKSSHS